MDKPVGTVVTYAAGCPGDPSCECIPLSTTTFTKSSTTSVNVNVALPSPATLTPLYQPAWATGVMSGSDLVITGTAPKGENVLVYEAKNECSTACITVKLTVTVPCTPPANVVAPLSYKTADNTAYLDTAIPEGSEIIDASVGTAQASVYGKTLNISGVLQQPFPTTYLVHLKNDCGSYTVSGPVVECVSPSISQITGSAVLEKGVVGQYGWVVQGTGSLSVKSSSGIPAGMVFNVIQNSPSVGYSEVRVSGTPIDNPCPNGSCTTKFQVSTDCGVIELSRNVTQQPCRAIQIVGETGSSTFVVGTPVNYCKIVSGYEPTIEDFSELPLGVTVSIAPHTVAGQWKVCLAGTPIQDPCNTTTGTVCNCAKVMLKNSCGTKEVQFCTAVDMIVRPTYCLGLVKYTPQPSGKIRVEIIGAAPNTTATVLDLNIPVSIALDGMGYGFADVVNPFTATTSGSGYCITVIHPTCALVIAGGPVSLYCSPPAATGGP